MRAEPLRIRCEGSGCPEITSAGMCPMCGGHPGSTVDGIVVEHDREDILAELARGDFG